MSEAKKSNARVPLTPDTLRKVVGGQGDNGRDRQDTAVLIEQSIVGHDAGASPPTDDTDTGAIVAAAMATLQQPAESALAGETDLLDDMPDLESTPEAKMSPVAAKPAAAATAAVPAPEAVAQAEKLLGEMDIDSLDDSALDAVKPQVAAKVVKGEAGKTEMPASKAAPDGDDAVESMADNGLPPLKVEPVAKAGAPLEPEAQNIVKAAETKVAAAQKAEAAAVQPNVEALIQTTVVPNHGRVLSSEPTQDLKVSSALEYDQEKDMSAARKVDAEGRDLSKKFDDARIKHGPNSKEAAAAAKQLSDKVVERHTAMLPGDYRPHLRVAGPNPWAAQADAGDRLLKALKARDATEIAAAQKHYDSVKMPDDTMQRERWFAAKQQQADISVKTLLLKKEQVETKLDALNKSYTAAQNELIKHNQQQATTLDNHYKDMRDLTKEARAFFTPKIRVFGELHKKFTEASLRVDMANAYRSELLKDIKAAQLDLVRSTQFIAANKQAAAVTAQDVKSAGENVAKAADLKDQKLSEAQVAKVKDDAAREATRKIVAAGEAASKEFSDKRDAYRKIDPAADQRIKDLELKQKQLKDANQIRSYQDMTKGSIDGHMAEIESLQKKMDAAGKTMMDAKGKLHASLQGLSDRWNWDEAMGLLRFRASVDLVTTNLKWFQYANSEYVKYYTIISGYNAQLDGMKAELAAVGEKLDLARLPPAVAVKVAEVKVKQAIAASSEGNAKMKALLEKARLADNQRAEWKRKIDISANHLRNNASTNLNKEYIKRIETEISGNWLEWQHATRAHAKAAQEHVAFQNSAENKAFRIKILQASENLAAAQQWLKESQAQSARDTSQVRDAKIKATADLDKAWTNLQSSADATRKAMEAEQHVSANLFIASNEAQKATFDYEAARNVERDVHIKQLKVYEVVRQGEAAAKAPLYAKALASLAPSMAAIDAAMVAETRATAHPDPQPEAAKGQTKEGALKDAVKNLNTKAKVDAPASSVTAEYEKKSGEKATTKKLGTAYDHAVDKAKKDGKPVPSKADFNAKLQSNDLEKIKASAVSKARELGTKLAGDIVQDLLRTYAEKTGKVHKVGEERVLVGQHQQAKLVNGTLVIDTVAQISMETKAEAYLSNLGVYGSAGLGLKMDVGGMMKLKTPLGGGVASTAEMRAYASGKLDLEAEGRVNVLGLAADVTAKATVMGEISGYSGFDFGAVGSMSTGGEAIAEASATAKGGAKLGVDGLSLKGSAAVEAAARASYVQKATFGGADFHSAGEVWAKAKAEATASLSGGMVDGEFKFGGKLSAMAGAGAGIQETKKVKFLGMELEGTLGVQVGSLGGTLGADVSFKDGTLKWSLDIGAALGLGISLKLAGSINFPAMVAAATKLLTDFVRLIDENAGQKMHIELLKLRMKFGEKVWS